MGVLVTLKQAQTLTILGPCACAPAKENLPRLDSVGLPSPEWVTTIEEASSHFPGGCGVREGVWVCLEPGTVASDMWTTLVSKSHLLVRPEWWRIMFLILFFLPCVGSAESSGICSATY